MSPIACHIHDYVEVACMYRYTLRLTFKDQTVVEGIAKDIVTRQKNEFLILDDNQEIDLTRLHKMEVLTESANFKSVNF